MSVFLFFLNTQSRKLRIWYSLACDHWKKVTDQRVGIPPQWRVHTYILQHTHTHQPPHTHTDAFPVHLVVEVVDPNKWERCETGEGERKKKRNKERAEWRSKMAAWLTPCRESHHHHYRQPAWVHTHTHTQTKWFSCFYFSSFLANPGKWWQQHELSKLTTRKSSRGLPACFLFYTFPSHIIFNATHRQTHFTGSRTDGGFLRR